VVGGPVHPGADASSERGNSTTLSFPIASAPADEAIHRPQEVAPTLAQHPTDIDRIAVPLGPIELDRRDPTFEFIPAEFGPLEGPLTEDVRFRPQASAWMAMFEDFAELAVALSQRSWVPWLAALALTAAACEITRRQLRADDKERALPLDALSPGDAA
jgi:hypothetical protein